MKKVKGFFVIVIKQFDTTMFDADYHYTPWCIALDKYSRFEHVDKLMKFDTYAEAEQYIKETEVDITHDRILEIVYLTTPNADDDPNDDSILCNWLRVKGEEDALNYDLEQAQGNHTLQKPEKKVPHWDTTQFSSIYTNTDRGFEHDSINSVKGFFVIVVKQFDTTMFDADYHFTPWCVALDRYCRFEQTEKLMKFKIYSEAEQYIKETEVDNTHDRVLEISYLTTPYADDDSSDNTLLTNWIQIKGEEDAFNYDAKQAQDRRARQEQKETPHWDTNKFSSLHTENGPKLNSVGD